MRTFLTVLLLLTVAPVSAVTALVYFDPQRWGGEPSLMGIIGMAVFGLVTVPLWLTYLPSLVLTPLVMRQVSALPSFRSLPVPPLVALTLVMGASAGILVLSPLILMAIADSSSAAVNWIVSGGFGGAVTSACIVMVYRLNPEPEASPNMGPATSLGNSGGTEGPPSVS